MIILPMFYAHITVDTTMHSHARGVLELDYTRIRISAVNTTIAWRYSSFTCRPSVFTVEGYVSREMALNLSTSSVRPTLALNSTSTKLMIPTSTIEPHITSGALFFRLLAFNQSGTQCASDSSVVYYRLDNKSELKIIAQHGFSHNKQRKLLCDTEWISQLYCWEIGCC